MKDFREFMTTIIRLTRREELKALPILLRHSPGMMLPNRTYVLSDQSVNELGKAGVAFTLIARDGQPNFPLNGRILS